ALTFANTHEDSAPPGRSGQRMILQQGRSQAAEHAVAVLGETPEIAVELLIPVGKRALLGQVFDLIDVARAQAAAIDFLQCHEVKVGKQITNALQVAGTPGMGQQMLPTARQVVVITLGVDADLDIETEQTQKTIGWPVGLGRAMRVDLRVAQTNRTCLSPAAQHALLSAAA